MLKNNPDAIINVVFATSNNIPADGTSTASVTAQVTDSAGAGLSGQSVVFTATAGALIGSPVITDTSGLATTTLTSTTAGVSSVTASVNSSTGHVDITFTEAALSPVISSLISDKDSIVNDGTDKATFVATVSDRGTGETLTGVTVHWSSSPGTVLPAISLSNDSGLAVAALSDSGDTGEATVTASLDNGEIATCDINLESSDVSWVISKLTSSKDTVVNDGVDTVKFTVTVKDGSGSTVSGATVSWVTTLGTLNHKQQVTDESGHAFVKLSDTGDTGEATVTASLNNGDEKTCPVLVQASVTAQTVRGGRRCGGYSRDSLSWLVTLDRETGRPTEALWQYEGDSTGVTAVWFDDPAPVKILRVLSLAGETLATLCPLNIVGYSKAVAASGHSFAALNTGGGAVGWGEIDVPSSIATRTDLVTLESAGSAFAALTTAGGVVTWGNSTNGGSVPSSIGSRTDLVALAGTAGAFAVLTKAGGVVAWGGNGYGETVPPMIANRTDLMYLTGIAYAFAALTAGGGVVGWGNSDYGGIVPSAIASRTDLVALSGSGYAFAALTASGGVVAWGGGIFGGSVPPAIASRTDLIALAGTDFSICALTASGSVVAWGTYSGEGTVPSEIASRTDLVMLASTVHAFAALTASGGVVAWGGNAGTVPVEIANRTDLVTLAGNGFAFAALTASGGVVTWGDSRYGGSIPEATQPLLTEVVAIYTSEYAFCALKADNTVVVWGYADAGNMSNVPASLQDNISYYQE